MREEEAIALEKWVTFCEIADDGAIDPR